MVIERVIEKGKVSYKSRYPSDEREIITEGKVSAPKRNEALLAPEKEIVQEGKVTYPTRYR